MAAVALSKVERCGFCGFRGFCGFGEHVFGPENALPKINVRKIRKNRRNRRQPGGWLCYPWGGRVYGFCGFCGFCGRLFSRARFQGRKRALQNRKNRNFRENRIRRDAVFTLSEVEGRKTHRSSVIPSAGQQAGVEGPAFRWIFPPYRTSRFLAPGESRARNDKRKGSGDDARPEASGGFVVGLFPKPAARSSILFTPASSSVTLSFLDRYCRRAYPSGQSIRAEVLR